MDMKVYAVGIGPGEPAQMTRHAGDVLSACDVIVGYGVYVDLVRVVYPDKEYITTPMKKETERCRIALEQAAAGRAVAVVCSGDAGVYGMAGLMIELTREFPGVTVEVVAGVTAALSGGAVLGAPLAHDFAVISLSDLLTPWELIEKRLECAAMGDFAICLYNPSSKKRHGYLKEACGILLQYQKPDTVCGIVKNIGREGEKMEVTTLARLADTAVDMFTTVFIGNSMTEEVDGRMVTPRGYRHG
ncbi:MAG TPA: precorrin-3B C(17)-methyltransferase [Clostridiales bacterium]|nr:precorrin-3B C(17)-methyltransferase [Clostridiales bacterium]